MMSYELNDLTQKRGALFVQLSALSLQPSAFSSLLRMIVVSDQCLTARLKVALNAKARRSGRAFVVFPIY